MSNAMSLKDKDLSLLIKNDVQTIRIIVYVNVTKVFTNDHLINDILYASYDICHLSFETFKGQVKTYTGRIITTDMMILLDTNFKFLSY